MTKSMAKRNGFGLQSLSDELTLTALLTSVLRGHADLA